MLEKTRRLALYSVLGITAIMILYPPFELRQFGASMVEYGFLFTGPATARNAAEFTRQMLGPQAAAAAPTLTYSLDVVRLLIQLVIPWGILITLLRTVLQRSEPVSAS